MDHQEFDSGCDQNGQYSRRVYFRVKNIKKSENESSSKVVLESVRKLFDACRTLNTAKYVACFIIFRGSRRRYFIEGVFFSLDFVKILRAPTLQNGYWRLLLYCFRLTIIVNNRSNLGYENQGYAGFLFDVIIYFYHLFLLISNISL